MLARLFNSWLSKQSGRQAPTGRQGEQQQGGAGDADSQVMPGDQAFIGLEQVDPHIFAQPGLIGRRQQRAAHDDDGQQDQLDTQLGQTGEPGRENRTANRLKPARPKAKLWFCRGAIGRNSPPAAQPASASGWGLWTRAVSCSVVSGGLSR